MDGDVFQVLIGDLLLAGILFVLFSYVARLSRHLRGIATWGAAHFVYTLGATLLDAVAPALAAHGHITASLLVLNGGTALACGGMAGLGWSMIQFARQRALSTWELALVPIAVGFSLIAWWLDGSRDGQGVALSIVEIGILVLMLWHLRTLRRRPDQLPARMMMAGCVALIVLYGSAVPGWRVGRFGLEDIWVGADLSIWFMLNFCMLMLTSFRAAESLRQSAMVDPLTGALNRLGLQTELQARVSRRDAEASNAVIAMDLDHFKAINDSHGHVMGDLVLRRFGDLVRDCIRAEDLFARLGGEEFAVVMHDTDEDATAQMAERIRARVAALGFAPPAPPMRVTVSIGVSMSPGGEAFVEALRRADEAMYAAKRQGRNRIHVHAATQ